MYISALCQVVLWLPSRHCTLLYEKAVDVPYRLVSIYCNSLAHLICSTTDWRAIPTCLEKLTVRCSVTSVCCCWVLWVIQCICMEQHPDNCSGSPAAWEGLWLCSWYTWLLSKPAPPPTHTSPQCQPAITSGSRRMISQNIKVLLVSFLFQGFIVYSLFSTFHKSAFSDMHTSFPKEIVRKMIENVNISFHFN